MEQAILNPAKYIITDLSIDTRFADQYNSGTADFTIRLPDTYKNLMRLALSSVEVPLVEYVFSERRRNVTFAVRVGGGPVMKITIPSGNYGAVALAAAVQEGLQVADPSGGVTCSYDTVTDRFSFDCSGGSFRLCLTDPTVPVTQKRYWGLGYYMGFRTPVILMTGSSSYAGTQPPQLGPTPYYLMQVSCPDQVETTVHATGAQSWIPALAKIVLRSGVYAMQFDDAQNRLRKEITFAGPTNVGQLRVRLVDPYGDLVDLGDVDWSMTFEITAVMSSEKYEDLTGAFGRG